MFFLFKILSFLKRGTNLFVNSQREIWNSQNTPERVTSIKIWYYPKYFSHYYAKIWAVWILQLLIVPHITVTRRDRASNNGSGSVSLLYQRYLRTLPCPKGPHEFLTCELLLFQVSDLMYLSHASLCVLISYKNSIFFPGVSVNLPG